MSIAPRLETVQCLSPAGLHRMAYAEWGDPHNPRVLVCVHGLTRVGRDFDRLARALSPLFTRLMPGVPAGHPAISSMTLNLAANALGLDNAATPLGIKAMKDLQSLNPTPEVASNAQILFLVLNTSSVTLLPVSGIIQGGLWPELADRWAYVPAIALFLMAAWAWEGITRKLPYRQTISALLAAIILLGAAMTTRICTLPMPASSLRREGAKRPR